MSYILLACEFEEYPIILGLFSTREKADEQKNIAIASRNLCNSRFFLLKKELDVSSDSLGVMEYCIYEMERREKKIKMDQEKRQIKVEEEKEQQRKMKILCDDIIKKFDNDVIAKEAISALVSQFNICCVHMDSPLSYDNYPPIATNTFFWSKLCDAGKYLSEIEMSLFAEFFKLFGINLMCGFSLIK